MINNRNEKVTQLIKELSAKFLAQENNKTSLITVTSCSLSSDGKRSIISITVLPDNKEQEALNFAKRQRKNLREYLKKNINVKLIPFIDIQIDKGEKNRQKIDELLREQ